MTETFSITNMTKGRLPSLPFVNMKEAILGKEYALDFVIIGNALSQKLNREKRGKDYPANVLSFPLEKDSGQIFLNPALAKTQAPDYEMDERSFLGFLFIHGLLHLKGMAHGSIMENEEKKWCKRFKLS